MRLQITIVACASMLPACREPDARKEVHTNQTAAVPVTNSPDDAGRDDARLVLEAACGGCHISAIGGLDGALAVFDLSQDDWAGALSPEQAADIVRRLRDPMAPSMEHPDGEQNPTTPAEIETVQAYLAERVGIPPE